MDYFEWTKFPQSGLYKEILNTFSVMLDTLSLKERDYHAYLAEHPAIFLAPYECYLVVSKLKLGSEYETDFVTMQEGYSAGMKYTLYEIESPNTALFDSKGRPSQALNTALQQIRDWKRFLINDKSFFKKYFPTSNTRVITNSQLKFKIIIGRRLTSALDIEKRRQISELENVEILSYDRLLERSKGYSMFFNEGSIASAQMLNISRNKLNELANPFYRCTKDSEWRAICNKGTNHFYSRMIDNILDVRNYNGFFDKFKDEI